MSHGPRVKPGVTRRVCCSDGAQTANGPLRQRWHHIHASSLQHTEPSSVIHTTRIPHRSSPRTARSAKSGVHAPKSAIEAKDWSSVYPVSQAQPEQLHPYIRAHAANTMHRKDHLGTPSQRRKSILRKFHLFYACLQQKQKCARHYINHHVLLTTIVDAKQSQQMNHFAVYHLNSLQPSILKALYNKVAIQGQNSERLQLG